MLKSNLCDYSDAYTLVKGTISVANTAGAREAAMTIKKIVYKNCAPFTDCISEINNTQIDDAKGILVEMPIFNVIECTIIIGNDLEVYGMLQR